MPFHRILFLFVLLCTCFTSVIQAQKTHIQGEAEILIHDPLLMKQYEFEVLQDAINNALFKAFGSSVVSNYESVSETSMSGRNIISSTQSRSQYINSFPNGIWLENKKDPDYSTYKDKKGNWWLKCVVSGYGKVIQSTPVEFIAEPLDGTNILTDKSNSFMSGESGYLRFKSAKTGYLIIFYDDFNTVQRCLPYNKMQSEFIPVAANKDYIFFSPEHADEMLESIVVDQIEFYTEKGLEYNQFYVLFSPKEFALPILEQETYQEDNYASFKSVNRKSFHKWLQNSRSKNNNLQVEIIGVTIKSTQN